MRSAVQSCDPLLLKLTENQALAEKSQVFFSYMGAAVEAVMIWYKTAIQMMAYSLFFMDTYSRYR